jgi:hypothetical protein
MSHDAIALNYCRFFRTHRIVSRFLCSVYENKTRGNVSFSCIKLQQTPECEPSGTNQLTPAWPAAFIR